MTKILENVDIFVCIYIYRRVLAFRKELNVTGFKTYRKDRECRRGGGILTLVHNKYAFKERTDLIYPKSSIELAGITITNVTPKLEILAGYRASHLLITELQ